MASGGLLPPAPRGHHPPPGTAFNLDEWIPCEAYLGCAEQREVDTGTTGELAQMVRKLYRRHERNPNVTSTEVYVRVIPAGLFLRVMTAFQPGTENDGTRDGVREFFETVRIARCTANHEPCTRALLWVYNRQPFGGPGATGMTDRRVECHGVVCRDLRDATRLANTLAMAFYEMQHMQQAHSHHVPVAFGNATGGIDMFAGNACGTFGGPVINPSPMLQQGVPELPPAYTPTAHHGSGRQLPPLRGHAGKPRNSSGGKQILEVAAVHQAQDEDDGDEDSDLHPSPRSVTPREDIVTGIIADGPHSPNSRDESVSPRRQYNPRNSTVSLHSEVALSERGTRSGALPDVSTDSWGSSIV